MKYMAPALFALRGLLESDVASQDLLRQSRRGVYDSMVGQDDCLNDCAIQQDGAILTKSKYRALRIFRPRFVVSAQHKRLP